MSIRLHTRSVSIQVLQHLGRGRGMCRAMADDRGVIVLSEDDLRHLRRCVELATEALAVFRQTIGPDHPRTAVAASILGYSSEVKGDRARAEQMYRLALAIDERAYGPKSAQAINDARVLNEFLKSAPKPK